MKAALVNKQTEIVDNIIIANSLEDFVGKEHLLVEIDMIEVLPSEEEIQLSIIIQQSNPNYTIEKKYVERPVRIGITKWNVTNGFYEE